METLYNFNNSVTIPQILTNTDDRTFVKEIIKSFVHIAYRKGKSA